MNLTHIIHYGRLRSEVGLLLHSIYVLQTIPPFPAVQYDDGIGPFSVQKQKRAGQLTTTATQMW